MTMDVAKTIKEIRKHTLYNSVRVNLKYTWNNLSAERYKSPKLSVGNKGIIRCCKTIQIKWKLTKQKQSKTYWEKLGEISPCKTNSPVIWGTRKPASPWRAHIVRKLFFPRAATIHCVTQSDPHHLDSWLCSIWHLTPLIRTTY